MIPLADNEHLLTWESVTEGHQDTMADQISDAILDAALTGDPDSRAAHGHFGRDDADCTREKTDKADELRAAAGL